MQWLNLPGNAQFHQTPYWLVDLLYSVVSVAVIRQHIPRGKKRIKWIQTSCFPWMTLSDYLLLKEIGFHKPRLIVKTQWRLPCPLTLIREIHNYSLCKLDTTAKPAVYLAAANYLTGLIHFMFRDMQLLFTWKDMIMIWVFSSGILYPPNSY